MIQDITDFFQEEAWQRVSSDAEDLVREMVEQRGHTEFFGELKQRFVKLKLGHLKLRLVQLKQNLQQHLAMLEEQLENDPDDDPSRYLLAQGAERLADMWLMESLFERLGKANGSDGDSEQGWPGSMLYASASRGGETSNASS